MIIYLDWLNKNKLASPILYYIGYMILLVIPQAGVAVHVKIYIEMDDINFSGEKQPGYSYYGGGIHTLGSQI